MVSFHTRTANPFYWPKRPYCNIASNFLSIKNRCLLVLKRCSSMKQLSRIHALTQTSGLHRDEYVVSQLLRFYALPPFGSLSYALSLLNHFDHLVPSSWNNLIKDFAKNSLPREAIMVFLDMRSKGIRPNNLTFPFVLKACAMLLAFKEGENVFADVVKHGLDSNVYVQNTLIHLYGSCKKIFYACRVFDQMSGRTVVSWNAIMSACVENSLFNYSIEHFVKMRNSGFEPDETTMVILLSVCTELTNLSLGKCVHSQVIEKGLVLNCHLGTALVNMYSKCGWLDYASFLFDKMLNRNVWTWSAMILGLAQHGLAEKCLQLFSKMKSSSIHPNYVTFVGVLCACSHAGLVDDGYRYFHDMEQKYGIKPMMIHYGTMVDILSRSGRLKEAYNFIVNMPIDPDPIIWRTLLSTCSSIHNINGHTDDADDVAFEIQKKLLELEPKRSGNLVMVANMYAEVGLFSKAENVRKKMKDAGLMKTGGESCVEVGGLIYKFYSGSGSDSKVDFEGIHQLLDRLDLHMKMLRFS